MTDSFSAADNPEYPRGPNVRPPVGAKRRLFLGFGAQTAALLFRVAQQFLLVPILIRGWGTELYADWIIIYSATGFLSILDFGLKIYFGNALIAAWSNQRFAVYRRLISVAMFIYASILSTAVIALAGISAFVSWPALFGTHVMNEPMALHTAIILAISTLLPIPFGLVCSVYQAHGDYSRGTVMFIMVDALRGFGICLVVLWGGLPVTAALIYFVITVFYCIGLIFDQWRFYGEFQLGVSVPKPAELRQALSRATLYLAPTLTSPVVLYLPVLMLSAFGTVSGAVVAYTVSRTFTGFMRQMVSQFCHPVGAEMARQATIGDRARLRRVFMGAGRLVGGAAGLLGGFTLIVAGPFLRIWTRGEVAFDPWLVGAFIAAIILTAPAQVALMLYQYNNRPRILVIAQGAYMAGTATLCLLLIKGFSATGAATAAGLAEFLSIGLLLPYAAAKEISVSLRSYFARSYSAALGAFILSYGVARGWNTALDAHGFVGLIELAMIWAAVVIVPTFFLLLESQERQWVLENIGKQYTKLYAVFTAVRKGLRKKDRQG